MEESRFSTAVEEQTLEFSVQIPRPRVNTPHHLTDRCVVVVGINYAPEPTGNAPYTTAMAQHLARRAQSVSVLTGMPHYPSWTLDPSYRWVFRTRELIRLDGGAGLDLRRLRHYVPNTQNTLTRAAFEASFFANAVSARLQRHPDLVIAVTPSLSGAVAGAQLARRHGSKLIVVVQDLMAKAASQSGIRGGDAVARVTGTIERYALRRAHLVAMVSEAFRPQVHEYGVCDRKIRLLPNWTHIRSADLSPTQARRALGWPEKPFTVVHTGNIGLKQDLGNLVEAARLCGPDQTIRFVIVGDGSQRAAVETRAAGLGNLEFVDPLDQDSYPTSLAAADLLVVNERPGVGYMSLPSKLTSYLAATRPVIAAVAENGSTAAELLRTGGAARIVPPGDPAAPAAGIRAMRDDGPGRARMAAAGRRYALTALDPEAAAARLDALTEECLRLP